MRYFGRSILSGAESTKEREKDGRVLKMKIVLRTLYIPMYHGYFLSESNVNKLSMIFACK